MAVRGVVTTLTIYPGNRTPATLPLYRFQNHFEGSYLIGDNVYSATYQHNFFQTSGYTKMRDASTTNLEVNFVATAANVDLVEAAIVGRYDVEAIVWRWGITEGLDNPTTFNLFALYVGFADTAESDFTTISLKLNSNYETTKPDFPWRKIPWTILGPLSFRR